MGADTKSPRVWVEFDLEAYPSLTVTTYRWGQRPVAASTFLIEGRIPAEGLSVTRRASSSLGEYSIDNSSIVLRDYDGLIRNLLAQTETQWFKNRYASVKLLSEAGFVASLTPRILFTGRVFDIQLADERKADLDIEDILAPYIDKEYPQYTLQDAYPQVYVEQEVIDATLDTDDPGINIALGLRDQVMPIYYGPFVDSAVDPVTGEAAGKGMCPTYFIGYTYLTAGDADAIPEPSLEMSARLGEEGGMGWGGWGELHVGLGEYDISSVYISNGVGFSTEPGDAVDSTVARRIVAAADRYGVDILAPGHPNWPFATNYVMRNGFRTTVIYARGPVLWHHITGVVNITVDPCGWKNSDGDAITQAGFAFQDFLTQHVLSNNGAGYTAGPPVSTLPTFANGDAMFWTSKIQDWQTLTADRLNTDDGYLISMALNEKITLREWIKRFHVTFDCYSAKNSNGQLYLFSIDDLADPTDGVPIRERMELVNLPAPQIAWNEIENSIDYTYGWDPEQNTSRTTVLNLRDDTAIEALKEERKPNGVRDLRYTSDDATAIDTIGRRVMRLKRPSRYQRLPVRLGGVDRQIGEQILVSHQDGLGSPGFGYVNQPMTIVEHHQSRNNQIDLVAIDISQILMAASRWATDVIPNWDSASAEEQAFFGFWADDDDTLGTNNDPATEWR